MKQSIQLGDKVTFDNNKIDIFKAETSISDEAVIKYQKLVLAGINLTGIVKELDDTLTTVSFSDGWELPIPTKYLILTSSE